jgi:hypothetical protein
MEGTSRSPCSRLSLDSRCRFAWKAALRPRPRPPNCSQPACLTTQAPLSGPRTNRKEDPLSVGLLALCIQQDGLDELLFKVKKRTAPAGTARSQTHRRGTRTRGVNAPLCGDNDSP